MTLSVRPDFDVIAWASRDLRRVEQLTEHYLLERRLATALKEADGTRRRLLYREAYDSLFAGIPHHPQRQATQAGASAEYIVLQSRLLRRLVPRGGVLLEIGAGDGRLTMAMADHCARTIAVDVTDALICSDGRPANFEVVMTDGVRIALEDGVIDFAYSNQLMEHLHPDDANAQLREIVRVLRPGGAYLCITPNVNSGPHDISKFFDYVATGFHLKEYSYGSLDVEMRAAGFAQTAILLVRRGRYVTFPVGVGALIERGFLAVERLSRRPLRWLPQARSLLGVTMLATKARTEA